jgi:hypothetical protein
VKLEAIRGIHGVVLEVADPAREARRWSRALGLPVLRRRRSEIVLGSLAFFVVLRKSAREARVAELHVAVEGLKDPRLERDDLGGRHVAREVAGARLVVRELKEPPSRAWLPTRRK